MTTGKIIALTIQNFVAKWCLSFFNTLSSFVSFPVKRQLSSNFMVAVNICSDYTAQEEEVLTLPPFPILFAIKWWNQMPWSCFSILSFEPTFSVSSSLSSRGSLVLLQFRPLEWYHLHIWGCWYFCCQSWFQLVILAMRRENNGFFLSKVLFI